MIIKLIVQKALDHMELK